MAQDEKNDDSKIRRDTSAVVCGYGANLSHSYALGKGFSVPYNYVAPVWDTPGADIMEIHVYDKYTNDVKKIDLQ